MGGCWCYHVVEALGHAVVPGVDQVHLGALHGDGAAAGDLGCHLQGGGHHRLLIRKHSAVGGGGGKSRGLKLAPAGANGCVLGT